MRITETVFAESVPRSRSAAEGFSADKKTAAIKAALSVGGVTNEYRACPDDSSMAAIKNYIHFIFRTVIRSVFYLVYGALSGIEYKLVSC